MTKFYGPLEGPGGCYEVVVCMAEILQVHYVFAKGLIGGISCPLKGPDSLSDGFY